MIHNALKLAMRNKNALQNCQKAGCFKCLSVFESKDVIEYTDQGETGLCPRCGCDTVIAETIQEPMTPEYIKAIKEFIFE